MKWEEYKSKFYHFAIYKGKDQSYIEQCLSYAERLFKSNLPIIYNQQHLSLLVGYKEEYLIKVSNSSKLFYRDFKIPKKSKNEHRVISEPLPNLKTIQQWILTSILEHLKSSDYSKAFKKGYSIKDNARFHKKQNKVLTLDIKDYFGSIDYIKVFTFFRTLGYSKSVSVMLAQLCTLNNSLPQGAPTSPLLSNFITKRLDQRIGAFSRKHNIRYTRYADDLTFSGDFQEGKVINMVTKILSSEGFVINENKTRTRYQNQRQEVTGIVVNEKMQASRKYRRDLRQQIYYVKKFGLNSHVSRIGGGDPLKYLYKLIGMANFIVNVNPNDKEAIRNYEFLKDLIRNT